MDIPFIDCCVTDFSKAYWSQTTTIYDSHYFLAQVFGMAQQEWSASDKVSKMAGGGRDSDWGHMSETLVLVVIWVPNFCLLESGMTKLFFHASYAWD